MSFNPLTEKGIPIDQQLRNWSELNVRPYSKESVHPFTRCRVITMNGIEVEAAMFSHQFARHTRNLDIKRALAMTRRVEQQQQKAVNWLIPGDESTLEVTIGYEQVAVELTAGIAQMEPHPYAKRAYDFGLLEDFDHLYRYANLLDMTEPRKAEEIVGRLTEIMPGRPTIFHHRHPVDDVRRSLDAYTGDPVSSLHALTVLAAEQQTMNFYMTIGNRYQEPIARGLYLEIAQVEEAHVTHYESLNDASLSWTEMLVLHEYNECYLYHSFMQDEDDPGIKRIWELHLAMELEHLRIACDLMRAYDRRDPEMILPKSMPAPIRFESNKQYVRSVLASQTELTGNEVEFVPKGDLPRDHRLYRYHEKVHGDAPIPSERIIEDHRRDKGREYRFQSEGRHPVHTLEEEHVA